MPITAAQVQLGYLAYYGRPADPLGLNYWLAAGSGPSVGLPFLAALANTPQWDAVKAQGATTVLNTIYQNLFGRNVDSPGLAYWAGELAAGRVDLNTIAVKIIEVALSLPASNVDRQIMIARQNTAVAFTTAVDTPEEIAGYNSAAAFASAAAFMATIGTTPATPEQVNAAVANAVATVNIGQTFTLTTGIDTADQNGSSKSGLDTSASFKFTNANEKVVAPVGTLGTLDILIDPSTTDNDVLEYYAAGLPAPTLVNIETIQMNVSVANAGLDMANVSGTKSVEVTGTQNGQLVNINGTAAPTITLKDYNKTLTAALVTAAGTTAGGNAESLKFILNGTGSKAKLTLDTAVAGALESLNIESAGTAKNTLELTTAPLITAINKTTLTGAADLDLKVAHAVITGQEMDASGMTGKFTLFIDRNGAGTATTNLANVKGYDTLVLRDSVVGTTDSANTSNILTGSKVVLATNFGAASTLTVKGAVSNPNDSLTLVLDHETANTDLDFSTNTITLPHVENLTVISESAQTGNKLTMGADALKNLTIDGSSKVAFALSGTTAKPSNVTIKGSGNHSFDLAGGAVSYTGNLTIDASEATGDVTIDVSDFQGTSGGAIETATVIGGSGKNTIILGKADHGKYVVDAGAGDDIITVDKSANAYITLGPGKDTIKIDLSGVNSSNSNLIIQDFTPGAGGDVLSFKNVFSTTPSFNKGGEKINANEIYVLTTTPVSGTGTNGVVQLGDLQLISSAVDLFFEEAQKAIIILINDTRGYAEVYYIESDNNPGFGSSGDKLYLIASFEQNIVTLTGLNELVASNFSSQFTFDIILF